MDVTRPGMRGRGRGRGSGWGWEEGKGGGAGMSLSSLNMPLVRERRGGGREDRESIVFPERVWRSVMSHVSRPERKGRGREAGMFPSTYVVLTCLS